MDIDYTHVELCVAAHHRHCSVLDTSHDLHTQTASRMFGVPPEEVTPAMRRIAKERNFGTCYGRPPWPPNKSFTHLCRESLFFTQAEAARVTEHYFTKYPHMKAFHDAFYPEPE
jgi:DNA polymerase-1